MFTAIAIAYVAGVGTAAGAWFWAAKKHKDKLKAAADEAASLDAGKEFKAALAKVGIRL